MLPRSQANGPGFRFVVWVQGCSRRCQGCFNPGTHDHNGGYEVSVSEIIAQIPFDRVDGITISGGEPFEQTEELAVLLEETGRRGLDRLVYTGFGYEELNGRENHHIAKCLSLIDILIDGPYEKDFPPIMPWTGSRNQRVLQLDHGKIEKEYGTGDVQMAENINGELIIDESGNITMTGGINGKIIMENEGSNRSD